MAGLSASGLVLQDNGGDNLTLSSGASSFTFATKLTSGTAYSVTVLTQPTGETCSVASGTGTITADVTSVSISCSTNTYTIGGNISGLTTSGLVLQDNGGDSLTVNSGSSTFTFATKLDYGATYDVTVSSQPTGETCSVSSGTGTVSNTVTSVGVSCSTNTYAVTGSTTGLTSSGLKLQFYSAGQVLSVPGVASGATTYTYPNVPYGTSIQMTFAAQPGWETCTANSGDFSGAVTQDVTGEDLSCLADQAAASTVATSGYTLSAPVGVAVDSSGDLFVADSGDNKVYEVTSAGTVTQLASGYAFSAPFGVAVDSSGNVYVADNGDSKILEIEATGGVVSSSSAVIELANSTTFFHPDGVAVDAHGNVFVADTGHSEIDEITPGAATAIVLAGSTVAGCVDGNGTSAEFDGPTGIAVDSADNDNLYVADHNNSVIREITSVGTNNTVTLLAGGGGTCSGSTVGQIGYQDGTGTAALFADPTGVAVDAAGNVFVADNGNNAVREVTPQGVVTTVAGATLPSGSTGTRYSFNSPFGIAEDASSNLYVADTGNSQIVKLAP